MHISKRLLLLFLIQLSTASLAAPPGSMEMAIPEDIGFSSARLELVNQMLSQHIEDGRISGLVAGVARHGKVAYLQSMGWSGSLGTFFWADPESGTSVVIMLQIQPAEAYNIAAKFKAMVYQSMID